MNWKLMLALFIIVGVTGLLLFSEKGSGLKNKYIQTISGYFSKYTGKIIPKKDVNRTLPIEIKFSYSSLKGQEFALTGNKFSVNLKYDSASLGNQNIKLKNADTIDFNTENMAGKVTFDENNKMIVTGSADSVELNGLLFSPPAANTKLSFNLVGSPSSFSIENFENDNLLLSNISGTLTLSDWSPLALHNDNLNIHYIKGSIKQDGDSVSIVGTVESISLNGIDLSLKK